MWKLGHRLRKRVAPPVQDVCAERERAATNKRCVHCVPWKGEIYCSLKRLLCTDLVVLGKAEESEGTMKIAGDYTKDREFELLDHGIYLFYVVSVDEKLSSKSGNAMLSVSCEVVGRVRADGESKFKLTDEGKGHKFWENISLSDNAGAHNRRKAFIACLGAPQTNVDSDDWIGRRGMAEIGPDKFEKSDGTTSMSDKIKTPHAHTDLIAKLGAETAAGPSGSASSSNTTEATKIDKETLW